MRSHARRVLFAFALAMAMMAAGCTGAAEEDASDTPSDATPSADEGEEASGDAIDTDAVITMSNYEPTRIHPTNSVDTSAAEVLLAIYTPLIELDPVTFEPVWGDEGPHALAADVTSDDQVLWTITLKPGFTFHDGTPVTAQDMVDTWNFGALSTNGQIYNSYLAPLNIVGFDDLQAELDDEGNEIAPPAATEMSGLRVIDDLTFEIELEGPNPLLPAELVNLFAAHPTAFDDLDGNSGELIGNGPFTIEDWVHDERITLRRYDDYAGPAAKVAGVEMRLFSDTQTTFNEFLAGNLDLTEGIPLAELATAEETFGDQLIKGPTWESVFLGGVLYADGWDDPDRMRALSLAIDRQAIVDTLLGGTREPADTFTAPGILGHNPGICDACRFAPDEAADLWEQAGGPSTVSIYASDDPDIEPVLDAIVNQWRQNLGVEVEPVRSPISELITQLYDFSLEGPWLISFTVDIPIAKSFHQQLHVTGAGFNITGFSDDGFDALIEQANGATSVDEALEAYMAAEEILAAQMPMIPLWYGATEVLRSDRLRNVQSTPFNSLRLADIEVLADPEDQASE